MQQKNTIPVERPSQTKIVATVGPASARQDQLVALIRAGVDVFRVNTAHGSREEHQQRVETIRAASAEADAPVAILVDLAGPKIRLGELPDGQLECTPGMQVRFVRGNTPQQESDLTSTYGPLVDELDVGDRVMLADGTVGMAVEAKDADTATCRVTQPGLIRSRQGINLPGVTLSVPTLGDKDRDNARWAARAGIDFISLSFVRSANDIRQLKALIAEEQSDARVIAKIEKPEALAELDAIVRVTDGIMVARGDLGVEIDIAEVPIVQKRIITLCRRHQKPVITATQMLDSMQHSRLPTRAEATDVANAILDGSDACMLSGETAIGQYPLEAVKMMHRIALATEPIMRERQAVEWAAVPGDANLQVAPPAEPVNEITEATVSAAGRLAEQLDARMIVVATSSGATALSLSKNRHFVPTVGISDSEATLRRMCLYWGVIPLRGVSLDDKEALLNDVVTRGRNAGRLGTGDRIVLIGGTGLSVTRHNMIVVHELD